MSRLQTVATAISDAADESTCTGEYATPECKPDWKGSPLDLAVLLAANGYAESAFAKNVHEGKCRKDECDPYYVGGKVYHRARTSWQIQKTGLVTDQEWHSMVGTDYRATFAAARVATRILARGFRSCHTVHGAMSLFGGVQNCNWSGVDKRFLMYKKLLDKAKKLEKEKPENGPNS